MFYVTNNGRLNSRTGLEIPLNAIGDTLRNIWTLCCLGADGVGR